MSSNSDENNQRRSNVRLAAWIVCGMAALAALAVAFTLLTTNWRREGDAIRPDLPSLRQSLWVSLVIFALVCGLIAILVRRFNRPR